MPKIILIGLLMMACNLVAQGRQSQEQSSQTVFFHVTSVQQTGEPDLCRSGSCSAVRFKVEGYLDSQHNGTLIELVLTCDEYTALKPRPFRTNICARLHAGSSYAADVDAGSISFPYSRLNKAFETNYEIVSEKELSEAPVEVASRK